jgi:DNA-binding NarL/FixJ family response regulator
MMPHSILLYEDNQLLSESIQSMLRLNSSLKLLGAYENPVDVNSHLQSKNPDLLLMDIDAICAGASGYLLKKHISTKLFSAIEEALEGGAPMSPSIARMVLVSMQQKPVLENPYQLTPKEKEVLTSLSKGNSYKMIGVEYEISLDTVRSHIRKIYEKLHVHSQTEAVSKAINEKLV